MLYGFRPDKGRFTELLRILEKDWEDEGATGYGGVPQPVAGGRDRQCGPRLAFKRRLLLWSRLGRRALVALVFLEQALQKGDGIEEGVVELDEQVDVVEV